MEASIMTYASSHMTLCGMIPRPGSENLTKHVKMKSMMSGNQPVTPTGIFSGFCPDCFEWWSKSDLFEHFEGQMVAKILF